MKKYRYIFLLLISIVLSVFSVLNTSKVEYNDFISRSFNHRLSFKQIGKTDESINKLKQMCDEYDVSVAKLINNNYELTAYAYMTDKNFNSGNYDTNKYYSTYKKDDGFSKLNFFTIEKMNILPIDKADKISINGIFYSKINDRFIKEIDAINEKYSDFFSVYLDNFPINNYFANENIKYISRFLIVVIILNIIIILFYHKNYLDLHFKEITIKVLNGYSTLDVFFENIKKEIVFPLLVVFLAQCIISLFILYLNSLIFNLSTFIVFIKTLTLVNFIVFCMLVLGYTVIFYLDYYIIRNNGFSQLLKGKVKSNIFLNKFVFFINCSCLIVLIVISFFSTDYISDKKKYYDMFEQNKNYSTLNFTMPTYISENDKLKGDFGLKNEYIFKQIEKNGGVLYNKRTMYGENGANIPIVYVNDNYLKIEKILDTNSDIIEPMNNTEYEFNVLIPENYTNLDGLKKRIHEIHIIDKTIPMEYNCELAGIEYSGLKFEETKRDSKQLTEKYIPIKNSQIVFPYSSVTDIERDVVFIIFKNNNSTDYQYTLFSNNGIKLPVDDVKKSNEYISSLFNDIGYSDIDFFISSILNDLDKDLENLYIIIIFSNISIILGLFLYFLVCISYISIYYMNNKMTIVVKKINGYSFFDTNIGFYVSFILINILSMVVCFAIALYFKVNVPEAPFVTFIISIFLILFNILCFTLILKNKDKHNLVTILKGEE